eukprot:6050816-Alexandrium_andersonii.AAC.1
MASSKQEEAHSQTHKSNGSATVRLLAPLSLRRAPTTGGTPRPAMPIELPIARGSGYAEATPTASTPTRSHVIP